MRLGASYCLCAAGTAETVPPTPSCLTTWYYMVHTLRGVPSHSLLAYLPLPHVCKVHAALADIVMSVHGTDVTGQNSYIADSCENHLPGLDLNAFDTSKAAYILCPLAQAL